MPRKALDLFGCCTLRVVETWTCFCKGLANSSLQQPPACLHGHTPSRSDPHTRALVRACCALQVLMRKPRQGLPFALFRMLQTDDAAHYRPGPSCMEDELSARFYLEHPEWNAAARTCLRALATAIDMDVAAIERRHALSRRLVTARNVQSWVPTVATLSAEFTHRMVRERSLRAPPFSEPKQQLDDEPVRERPHKQQRTGPGKQEGAKGGGGGAWRAYMSEFFRGRRMDRAGLRQASART